MSLFSRLAQHLSVTKFYSQMINMEYVMKQNHSNFLSEQFYVTIF
jgi:hypothetical protein